MTYQISQIVEAMRQFAASPTVKKKGKEYINIPMSFDIETTSFYKAGNKVMSNADGYKCRGAIKCAVMYVWQFAICDTVIIGRKWSEFLQLLEYLHDFFNLTDNRYAIIYVHNLGYEFQFMRKWLKWRKVFSLDKRVPISAETDTNIIFKCSYKLSGYALDTVARNLQSKKIEKLNGYLQYDELRHSETELTKEEIAYCVNDVLIVTAYVSEQMERYGNIANIPLTQTGAVRRLCRNNCFRYKRYKWLMKKLTFQVSEYENVKKAYAGGFTHANATYAKQKLTDVTSYDFTSSYPYVMISEKYPMSKGRYVNIETEQEILQLSNDYALILDVKFLNIKSKVFYERILSYSKCFQVSTDTTIDNGRIDSAGYARMCITEQDFFNLREFYKWDDMRIVSCIAYRKRYLPKPIFETVLDLYEKKTTLKGIAGKETEYLHSKELLNSLYGMCVTNIVRNEYVYKDDEWNVKCADIVDEIAKYNSDKTRFLFYIWGVYVTAYARRNLFSAILECQNDYVYSDTDSVKILNAERHKEYFERYNRRVIDKLTDALTFHGIPIKRASPKNSAGNVKTIGIWDCEGKYDVFKTLGAKRYMTEKDGKISVTVAGLSKALGRDFIAIQKEPFTFFNDMMYIDREHSGRLTHTYCDDGIRGSFTDLHGKKGNYLELSFTHLEQSEYNLSLTSQYLEYILFRTRKV